MSNLKLTDREWQTFNMIDIFSIKDGYYNKKPPLEKNGDIPFLGATQYSNGITEFYTLNRIKEYDKVGNVSDKDFDKRIFEGGCIAITNNGSVGNAFYQQSDFTCSHDITPIYLKGYKMSKELAMFLIPMLMKTGESFEYGKKWRPKRMRRSKILLPVKMSVGGGTEAYTPDWQFMEAYIKQQEQPKIRELMEHYSNKALEILTTGGLKDRAWKEFSFSDIFTKIQRGKRLTKSNQIEGNMPYVSSTATNNGVDNFIANSENIRMFENCLSLANSGSVGSVFYHHYTFVGSDHITALELDKPNKYVYLFLSGVIKRLEEKYSFNREINDVRIKREKILLPIDQDENPDWQFMEDFMRKIEQDKVKTILEYYQDMTKCQWGGGGKS
ncbi:restriction endonuclease subunit S [Capnocytophaga canimorsus]|uniref:restriction endonuclease subunit S n=1 Tax=Capnocytophaga canimorsus TaxID=28188 RepID=UPI001AC0FB27|nr:restriction endonuclease subunit S [Capnocytophaga canimorsus]GIM58176.1 hypothetical protein CAPN007_03830 [Capnocytophaga canimorsus]